MRARLATIAGGLLHIAAIGAGAFSLDGYTKVPQTVKKTAVAA